MNRFPLSQGSIVERTNGVVRLFMAQVYGWMTCGLLLSAFVAWYASYTPLLLQFIFSNQVIFLSLIIIQLALVFIISGMTDRLSAKAATSIFMLYSVLNGLTLTSILIIYNVASVASTFIITAGMFSAMAFCGYNTKKDLSSFSSIILMTLIGISIASMISFWSKSSVLMWILNYLSVVIFVGLTAHDTQKLKNIGAQLSLENKNQFRKYSIVGALNLYLNFINLFLVLLRIFNNRR